MKRSILLFLLLHIALCAGSAYALTYTWPVVTSVTVRHFYPGSISEGADFTMNMGTVTVNDPEIGENDTLGAVLSRKGIDTYKTKFVAYHRHNATASPSNVVVTNELTGINFLLQLRFREYASSLSERYGSGTIHHGHNGLYLGNECVGTTIGPHPNNALSNFETFMAKSWNGGVGSAGDCFGVPPVNEWCALTTPTITFEYGTLSLSSAPGAVRQANVGVNCTTGMKFMLRLKGANDIALGNGLRAEIMADGKQLNTPLTGLAGPNTVSLTSTLAGEADRTGAFYGDSVLLVAYP